MMHTLQMTNMPGAARYIGMSRSWIRDAINSGRLPCVRLGRSVRLRYSDLDALISVNCSTGRRTRFRGSGLEDRGGGFEPRVVSSIEDSAT
jgi:excisionase family DNA binding protein